MWDFTAILVLINHRVKPGSVFGDGIHTVTIAVMGSIVD
jgi:hypothetical protein